MRLCERLREHRWRKRRKNVAYEFSVMGSRRRLRMVRYFAIQTTWVTSHWARIRGVHQALRHAPKFFRAQQRKAIIRMAVGHS